MKRRRGWCPDCARNCALTDGGRVWAHREPRIEILCRGTGKRPGDGTR